MSTPHRPIPPNQPRWKPASDPSTIVIPGLDTDASTFDQIEQIEQLITIKLQVRDMAVDLKI
jgi:DASH complex subunit ASK1